MNDFTAAYHEEVRELLTEIEACLMELEKQPDQEELLHTIFRGFHTIKGSGGMFGFQDVVDFTHEIENLFDRLRDGKLKVNRQIVDIALSAKDHIADLVFSPETADMETGKAILGTVRQYTRTEGTEKTYRIRFAPGKDFYIRGAKVLPLLRELEQLGTTLVFPHTEHIPAPDEMDPELCYCAWTILLTTSHAEQMVRDVFIFVEDYSEISIDLIDDAEQIDLAADYKMIGEILTEQGYIDRQTVETIVREKERFGDIIVDRGMVSEEIVESALQEQQYIRQVRRQRQKQQTRTTIRVQSERLDSLVDLVEELVTMQSRLSQLTENNADGGQVPMEELLSVSEDMARLTNELHENTMDLRMVPLTETFNGFSRLVRDLSNELQKEIRLETRGSNTELDKNIIDLINDPLVHIIRNSIDHGIETPDERKKADKTPEGTITIEAEYSGPSVLIRVRDDGRGLDAAAIHRRAEKKGLIPQDAGLSEQELYRLIFTPGFSTKESATNISGRGVGMDVVKRNIEKLRGRVDISTETGRGTCVELTIPLTLSIIEGLFITVGKEQYVINLSSVEECLELTPDLLPESNWNEHLIFREKVIPFIDLRSHFHVEDEEPEHQDVIIVRSERDRVALIADSIKGQYQTVIKPLNTVLSSIREISGSTILGDGSIAFILDTRRLMEAAAPEKMVTI